MRWYHHQKPSAESCSGHLRRIRWDLWVYKPCRGMGFWLKKAKARLRGHLALFPLCSGAELLSSVAKAQSPTCAERHLGCLYCCQEASLNVLKFIGKLGPLGHLQNPNGYGPIPINTSFSGMNIHKSQLFWCELQGIPWVLTHCQISGWSFKVDHQLSSTYTQRWPKKTREASLFESSTHLGRL